MVAAHGQDQLLRLRVCLARLVQRHSDLILKRFAGSVSLQPLVAGPPCDPKFSAQGTEIAPCFVCAYYKCSSLIFHSFLFPRHQIISSFDAFLPLFYHETVYHLSEHSVYYLTGPYTCGRPCWTWVEAEKGHTGPPIRIGFMLRRKKEERSRIKKKAPPWGELPSEARLKGVPPHRNHTPPCAGYVYPRPVGPSLQP